MSAPRSSLIALALALSGLLSACQKSEEHPPFAPGCEGNCPLLPGISAGISSAGSSSTNPDSDAGTGTLQGEVFLTDDSFVNGSRYTHSATVTADGADGSPVMGSWKGVDPFDPFVLNAVARVTTNWVSVRPDLAGGDDALPTYQALQTYQVTSVKLALVSGTALDGVFNAASTLRSPDSGQVIVFFRSAGTGAPLSGLHVTMSKAQAGIYATQTGWVLDDGTAVTDQSGLVVFGNIESTAVGGTQLVTVTRAATASTGAAAAGQFPVKVVSGAVSIAAFGVQL